MRNVEFGVEMMEYYMRSACSINCNLSFDFYVYILLCCLSGTSIVYKRPGPYRFLGLPKTQGTDLPADFSQKL